MRPLYAVLGVDKRASRAQIKAAYYAVAHRTHPDKHPNDPQAAAQFAQAAQAYAILSDPKKRRLYDRFGAVALRALGHAPPVASGPLGVLERVGRWAQSAAYEVQKTAQHFGERRADQAAGFNEPVALGVGLRWLLHGGPLRVVARRAHICARCQGRGAAHARDVVVCPLCRGAALDPSVQAVLGHARCPWCLGVGHTLRRVCGSCQGLGALYPYAALKVQVPPLWPCDEALRLVGHGGPPRRLGGRRGDLLVRLHAQSNAWWRIEGADVTARWPLTAAQLQRGVRLPLPFWPGAPTIVIPPGSAEGEAIEHAQMGLCGGGGRRGRLRIVLALANTDTLDAVVDHWRQQLTPAAADPTPIPTSSDKARRDADCGQ